MWKNAPQRFSRFSGPSRLWFGVETRHAGEDYRYHGMERGRSQQSAEVVFQCTLSGEGRFAADRREWRVGVGSAFFARLPSDHVYWMPDSGPPWTFFWMIIEHPFVVQRLGRLVEQRGAVVELPEESPAFLASINLITQSMRGTAVDEQDQEMMLISWMLEQERRVQRGHDAAPGAALRSRFEAKVRERMAQSFGIEELAASWGMSRSHFSHFFKKHTGTSPAAAVQEVRFGEVLRLLGEPGLSLGEIATQTGFADGNHLGKAFRRRWGMSPGRFRKVRLGVG